MSPRFAILSLVFLQACSTGDHDNKTAETSPPAQTAIELVESMRNGDITSEEAVAAYLSRIEAYDHQGPMIQSIISLNPNALAEARELDAEAAAGNFRGALHGVPVLVKDNIETKELPTTAGSLALIDNDTGRDAPIVARLRDQGAIVLGKTNLSEWANFRSNRSISGWSGVGGQTRNPHSLDRTPCGSSAGSAAAVASLFAPLAIGTETNGSITCPASMNGIVGFKPTVGLLSRTHIVPISSTQDTAGPMTRTVRDAAMMLTAMAGFDQEDSSTHQANEKKQDYVAALDRGVVGVRVGVFRWADGDHPAVLAAFEEAVSVLEKEGAILVEITDFTPDPVMWESGDALLRTQFKHTLNEYLANAAPQVVTRTLSDLIAFNKLHVDRELALFDQSIFIASEDTKGIDDPEYLAVVQGIRQGSRENGIDGLLKEFDVEVLVMPSRRPASPIDVAFASSASGAPTGAGWLAAMAGYPVLTVPMGDHRGIPLGLGIMGTAWDDGTVLAVGHAYEVAADKLRVPTFANGPFEMADTSNVMRPYPGN